MEREKPIRLPRVIWWGVSAVLLLVFLGFGVVVRPTAAFEGPRIDDVMHAAMSAAITFSLLMAMLGGRRPTTPLMFVLLVPGFVIGFGAAIEVAQHLVGRDAQVSDLLADAGGSFLAMEIWLLSHSRRGLTY